MTLLPILILIGWGAGLLTIYSVIYLGVLAYRRAKTRGDLEHVDAILYYRKKFLNDSTNHQPGDPDAEKKP